MISSVCQRWLLVGFVWVLAANWVAPSNAEEQSPFGPKMLALLQTAPLTPNDADDELRRVLVARYNAALQELKLRHRDFIIGGFQASEPDFLLGAVLRLRRAELDLQTSAADRAAVLRKHIEVLKAIESVGEERMNEGIGGLAATLARTRLEQLTAKAELIKVSPR